MQRMDLKDGTCEGNASDDDSIASGIDLINLESHKELAIPSEIRSTAVVKFESIEMPESFHQLRRDTNLNDPPSNWLHDPSQWESYIHKVSMCRQRAFSSFRMTHCYPELMGDIDVVSDAENIKKVLKMPFSKSGVSMMVHRIGNTLMLDEFDVHRYLLCKQESDWSWLRAFVKQTLEQNIEDKMAQPLVVRQSKLYETRMFSKFLYYSMPELSEDQRSDVLNQSLELISADELDSEVCSQSLDHIGACQTEKEVCSQSLGHISADQLESTTPHLSEALSGQPKLPRADHQRTVLWAFEHLNMLIGTDLPIFGGGTRPCISLKLRDSAKPINVLTGLDYWLDNLMCNVPEVAMCYHHNGIVQNYELLKTEDIPNLENSKFNPVVIKDIAQNILSFLKSNATKEGHTYWLFKGQNDDIVKLYDLSTLCAPHMEDNNSNPFTVPVGILLYRVARSMWLSHNARTKSRVIRALLNNCLQLLNIQKHAQVVTSAHFILSDLYISDDNMFDSPEDSTTGSEEDSDHNYDLGEDECETEEERDEESEGMSGETSSASVEVRALSIAGAVKQMKRSEDMRLRYPPITGSKEERSEESLKHIALGLQSLDSYVTVSEPSQKHVVEDQEQCDPNIAIPLGYRPLNPNKSEKAKSEWDFPCNDEMPLQFSTESSLAVANQTAVEQHQWIAVSKVLLLRKAAIVYHTIARSKVRQQKYGVALRYTVEALHCFVAMKQLSSAKAAENVSLLGMVMGLAGEVSTTIYHEQNAQLVQLSREFEMCQIGGGDIILALIQKAADKFDYPWIKTFPTTLRECLLNGVRCLRIAKESLANDRNVSEESFHSVVKHFGNATNELGVEYMKEATYLINEIANESASEVVDREKLAQLSSLWERSETTLKEGIAAFTLISDSMNSALLLSNLARLYRLCAESVPVLPQTSGAASSSQRQVTAEERSYYLQAAANYKKALDSLGSKSDKSNVWDSIAWELSTVYFNLATHMQDYSPLSVMAQQNIEAEICEYMKQALRYCDCDTTVAHRQVMTQYRAATIQHRLASLHHNAMRNETDDHKRKECRLLAETHYTEASHLFLVLESPLEFLRVQLERRKLLEFILSNQTSSHTRLKTVHASLHCILDCRPALDWLIVLLTENEKGSAKSKEASTIQSTQKDAMYLISLVVTKLQAILQLLCKSISTSDKKRVCPETLAHCKAMYAASLSRATSEGSNVISDCQHLATVLDKIISQNEQLISMLSPKS